MIGPFQEDSGAVSMRRVLAFFFSLVAVPVLVIGAVAGTMAGVYAGLGLVVAVIVLLFFTTWTDLAEAAKIAKGKE